ncbi:MULTISPECIES: ferritin-like domain-containing protein [Halomonadaceae]|uniref:ferritin-like domain-containing protein n=1 Tax=Halomonadaceae TaxID=28256 RepID=UPI001598DD3B|nr:MULTISPECIES: ferritin-like domain-containing protein [Halomonas]QJQ95104.1 ferritin-like domain-containing protein [Halomonas sp. PA5]
MNESSRKHLSDWLRDAHAMEVQADKMLRDQASRLEHYPELQSRIEKHIQETQGQLEKLESVIDKADMDTSAFKDIGAKFAAMGQSMGGMFVSDEVVKGGIASLSFEHFEIANYKALISAAEYCGELEVKRVCEEILKEEENMAQWLEENLPAVTQAFLARSSEDDVPAKR